jgi:hypothetical protein
VAQLQLEYAYSFMPKGLLSRLIVRLNRFIAPRPEAWRTGVVLYKSDETRALLMEVYAERKMLVRVQGPEARALMTTISDEIDHLHKRFPGLRVEKLVPCFCQTCKERIRSKQTPAQYKYDDLLRRLDKGKRTIECEYSYEDMDVKRLLDNIFQTSFFQEPAKRVFISYSKADKKYLEKLQVILKPLVREGKLAAWDDTRLLPGEEWDARIRAELYSADIVIFLLSADMLATDYIWEQEMTAALDRARRGKASVVPIIVRPCMWEQTPFARFNALPTKGKPISSATNQDAAWAEIAKRLNEVANIKMTL